MQVKYLIPDGQGVCGAAALGGGVRSKQGAQEGGHKRIHGTRRKQKRRAHVVSEPVSDELFSHTHT